MRLPPICALLLFYAPQPIFLIQQLELIRVQFFISRLLQQLLVLVIDGHAQLLLLLPIIG